MRFIPLLAVLLFGCATEPLYTYEKIQSIKPGISTREEILKTFGEPRSVAVSEHRSVKWETFSYYRMVGGSYYYPETMRTDMLGITLTNGIVRDFYKSQ